MTMMITSRAAARRLFSAAAASGCSGAGVAVPGAAAARRAALAPSRAVIFRMMSTAPAVKPATETQVVRDGEGKQAAQEAVGIPPSEKKQITSYWGVAPTRLTKDDGSEWRWTCFKDIHYQGQVLQQNPAPLGYH